METAVMSSVLVAPSQDSLALVSDLNENQTASLPMTSVIDQMLETTSDLITSLKKPSAGGASVQIPVAPVKRGRGRPRKKPLTDEPPPVVVKRKRGRPRKNPLPPSVDTQPEVSAMKHTDKISVEEIAENLAIATAIQQSGLNKSGAGNTSAGDTMNVINTSASPRKRGRPRKRPLESCEEPEPAKRPKEEITSSGRSPQLLQAEKPTLLFSLPECEVTKARVDIDLVEGPGNFNTTSSTTVVVNLKEKSPSQTAPPPSNTVAKRGRPKKVTAVNTMVVKHGRGRPPGSGTKKPFTETQALPMVTKRGRGRPRIHPIKDATPPQNHSLDNGTDTHPKRKRGRPPKSSVAKQQANNDESANLEESNVGVAKRGRGRPQKPQPLEESAPGIIVNMPKRGRGRPRKNRPPSIGELAEQILLVKDNTSVDQNGDPLPSVGGVVIQHANNERGVVTEKRKRGRPRKHPIPPPKPPGMKRKRGRPRIHPVVHPTTTSTTDDDYKSPSSLNSEPLNFLASPVLGMDLSPGLKKLPDSVEDGRTVGGPMMAEGGGNDGFKLHVSFSDSDSDGSEGMGVQDTDIQALAERVTQVTPPLMHPINTSDERDSPLLGSRFEESFDEDSDTEANK